MLLGRRFGVNDMFKRPMRARNLPFLVGFVMGVFAVACGSPPEDGVDASPAAMNEGPGANEGEISELDFGPVEPTTNLPDGADGGVTEQPNLSDGGVSETVDALIPETPDTGATEPGDWDTEAVYNALKPMCVSCHSAGQANPFFESLEAFVSGIVDDERYIVLGEPSESGFMDLLRGSYAGPYRQMPPGLLTYAGLTAGDVTKPTLDELAAWIAQLDAVPDVDVPEEVCPPYPSEKPIHRLNRTEYNNTVQLIFGTDSRPADDFPSEDQSFGLDNIAESLSVSPLLIEKYDLAAQSLSEEALPVRVAPFTAQRFEAESDLSATTGGRTGIGWNLWSNGDLTGGIELESPGTFQLSARVRGQQAGPDFVQMAVLVNGQPIQTIELAEDDFVEVSSDHFSLGAGYAEVGVRFLNDYYDPPADRNLIVDWIQVEGSTENQAALSQFEASFLSDCDLSLGDAAHACLRGVIERFGRFAWRRPLSVSEVDRLWTLASAEFDQTDGLRMGLRQVVHAILLSPFFIYRVEANRTPGEPLSGYERATRLAMFLWRSAPTESLLDIAADGGLEEPSQVANVALDMLGSAGEMIDDLGAQWLLLRQAALVDPEYSLFPTFDEELRSSMLEETRLVFQELWAENRSLLDLVNADFSYYNQRLAAHYDFGGLSGDGFQRVELDGTTRRGLLTHASWLAATSERTRTSPVKRGKWVLEELLCQAPPPPPPSVEGFIESVDPNASLRQRLEQHRADPNCASCHVHMDAIGFGLEQFDAIGAFRTEDHGELIEPGGVLFENASFDDATGLADVLRNEASLGPCVTEKMLTYALGRGLEGNDACFVEQVDMFSGVNGYRAESIVQAIVLSPMFLNTGGPQVEVEQSERGESP